MLNLNLTRKRAWTLGCLCVGSEGSFFPCGSDLQVRHKIVARSAYLCAASLAACTRICSWIPASTAHPCENTPRMDTHLSPKQLKNFQSRLLRWFRAHKRDLPWRRSRNPYRIWIAEVMLQQTRIAAVLPYYHRFLKIFPTVQSLASAPLAEILKLWSGLGYYSRARNLHRAAKEILLHHKGKFPGELDAALQLPGIGRYTAAAVLSIAYDVPL